jgi:hypothetical protein
MRERHSSFSKKIAARIIQRRSRGDSSAQIAEYGLGFRGHPGFEAIFAVLTLPERVAFNRLSAERATRKVVRDSVIQKQQAATQRCIFEQTAKLEAFRINAIREIELKRKASLSDAACFLASLPPSVRDQIATKDERTAAVALRKASVMKSKALAFIGCTATELDRWDADGRCSHAYKCVNPVYASKAPARRWLKADLDRALENRDVWRVVDKAKLEVVA